MTLIGPTQSSQFMEWHNLGITTLKHIIYVPNIFLKLLENQIITNFIYLPSSNYLTISCRNYWDQVTSWKNFLKFWYGPLCRNKSSSSALLNAVAYWKSSNTKVCAKKLSHILVNDIGNVERVVGLRIYVRYCRNKNKIQTTSLYLSCLAIAVLLAPSALGLFKGNRF